ncbi:MAG: helix-turn-helix domain-containing protein [Burkholderiaceae bacterium]|nr:helix-turn-helix domain-containing protein [Burkholderiaceae bacterium]
MPDIASLLKTEITRLARKEVRAETGALKKAAGTYRSEIAALKRRTDALERQLRHAKKVQHSVPSSEPQKDDSGFRFSPKGLASHRKRLGLSASDMGKLLGASGQSVYKWESGEARPRAANMPGIAAVRKLGRRDVAKILARLDGKS